MVLVPGGPFVFGRAKVPVTLGAFWIDKDPVTNRAYQAFVEKTERPPPVHWGGDAPAAEILDHPVVCVRFEDAEAYARFLGTRVVKGSSFRSYLGAVAWSQELVPSTYNDALGFRCLLPVAEPQPGEVA